jgi:hypothetical protein
MSMPSGRRAVIRFARHTEGPRLAVRVGLKRRH